jgi:RNA polymerase sigma-70 factor (ECF subfamily)
VPYRGPTFGIPHNAGKSSPAGKRSGLREISDETLMKRVQADDKEAFERLYSRYSKLAYSLACRICGRQLAEDATSSAFLAVWTGRRTFSPDRGTPRTWLLTVVRHQAIDALRSGQKRERYFGQDPDAVSRLPSLATPDHDAQLALEQCEQAATIRQALSLLPAAQREVVELGFFAGLTHAEIAAKLELPPGTVKGRMRLGLEKLRSGTEDALQSQCVRP